MNKLYKKILLILVILSVMTTITSVSAINDINDTISSQDTSQAYISPEGNDDSGDGSEKNPYNSIRHV